MQVTPFSKISIKDIVDRAGLTRQTFYHNFETKEDVLLCRLDEHFDGFLQYLSRKRINDWEDIICCFFRYWQEHADFVQLLMKNDLVYLLSLKMPDYFQSVKEIHFNRTDLTDAEARLWFAFVSGALVSTLTSWLKSSGGLSARALARLVLTMMDGSMLQKSRVELETGVAQLIDQLQSDSKNG
jgi:AcrR family transcriptional regulator